LHPPADSAWRNAAIVAGGYLLGAISWSYLIVKVTQGRDVRTVGSGNAGATNVMRAAGKAAGAVALALDCAKGIAAVVIAHALRAPAPVAAAAAVAVVAGHIFPIFLGFRGGKGVATAAGVLAALSPMILAADLLLFVLVVAWKRYISLGSMVAAVCFPLLLGAAAALGHPAADGPWAVAAAALIAVLIVARHGANLGRLRRGVEPRLGERRETLSQAAQAVQAAQVAQAVQAAPDSPGAARAGQRNRRSKAAPGDTP
jgi:glycerol-3-phosphate acyltransferase PlsY